MSNPPSPPTPSLNDTNHDDYWRARDDSHTLARAEAILADATRRAAAMYILEKEAFERDAALAKLRKAT